LKARDQMSFTKNLYFLTISFEDVVIKMEKIPLGNIRGGMCSCRISLENFQAHFVSELSNLESIRADQKGVIFGCSQLEK
jgi:hypothetical protein